MLKYKGSGRYWNRHLKEHGKEFVETLWYCLFTEKEELVKFALMISENMDIIQVKDSNGKKIWANEKFENGLDGGWEHVNENPDKFIENRKMKKARDAWKKKFDSSKEFRNAVKEHTIKMAEIHLLNLIDNKKYVEDFSNAVSLGKKGKSVSKRPGSQIGEKNSNYGNRHPGLNSGEKNPQFGTMWITDGTQSRLLRKNEMIPAKWRKGRTMGISQ